MTTIAAPAEVEPDEARVALTPEAVAKLVKGGAKLLLETGAGVAAGYPDSGYVAAGAEVVSRSDVLAGADILTCVRSLPDADLSKLRPGSKVVGLLDPHRRADTLSVLAARGLEGYAMELIPRITRAQSMDVLSSQANLAGYRAVIEAAAAFGRIMPMMTTAAGTIPPAKAFVMGAGVAGLQAIATARRLGAQVTATDVRPAAKEQVESLGAKFVAVEDDEFRQAEADGGYAKPMSEAYQAKQAELISEHIRKQDIVVTTALIPGRAAPRLVSAAQVASMRPGSVVVDMAVEHGGNVEGSRLGERVATPNGVLVLGYANLAGRVAADASSLYARNLLAFLKLLMEAPDPSQDEILKAACVARGDAVLFGQRTAA